MGRGRGSVREAVLCGLLVGTLGTGRAWAQPPLAAEPGRRALAQGREAFEALDMERALAQLEQARVLLAQPEQSALRSEAWSLKVAAQLAQGDAAGAQQEAQRLLAVDPEARFSPDHFPPEALSQLERTRQAVRAAAVKPTPPLSGPRVQQVRAPAWVAAAPAAPQEGGRSRVGLGLLAGGVLLVAGGAVLGLKAAGRQAALAPLAQNEPQARALRKEGRRLALLADLCAAAGLLSSAAGAALRLLRPKAHPPLPLGEGRGEGLRVSRAPVPPAAQPPAPVPPPHPADDDDLRNH